ncbi:MAG: NfeD family protein [Bacteroidetes bacterium]|nr:NfeD family protein [Bacteroidota bacterium]
MIIKDSNIVPLYFYVNGNDFTFGNAARDRFYLNDPNAYGNYFEIVKDPSKHFTIYGIKKPVKQLFYSGVEQYLSHFINAVLYKGDSIESYRQNFPLRFMFESDLEEREKALIENLFLEAGYFNIDRVDFNKSLFEVLSINGFINEAKSLLLLNGIDNNLYLELYKDLNSELLSSAKLIGQGADPRVKILGELILEYISAQNSFLIMDKDIELSYILPFCAGLLEQISPIIKGEVELSSGANFWFRVNERSLNDRLIYYINDTIIFSAIDEMSKINNIIINNLTILLASEEINTAFFLSRLLKKYNNVKRIEISVINDTMKLIFEKIVKSDYTANDSLSLKQQNSENTFVVDHNIVSGPSSQPLKPKVPPPPQEDHYKLIGKVGITNTPMNPTGKIIIENKIYQGFAEKSNLEIGMTVKVVGIKDKVVLKVERYIKTPELPKKKNNDYFLN